MNEYEIETFVKELQGNPLELYNFIAENIDTLTDKGINELVEEFESDYLSLKDFVINVVNSY